MTFDVVFSESNQEFDVVFNEVQNISDGGYERGYAAGYETGNTDGYTKGHTDGVRKGYADGLAARTYETWTITLVDGTTAEKEVALL